MYRKSPNSIKINEMKDFDNIYFVGAGGIGMAALERYFLSRGKKVAATTALRRPLPENWPRKALE